MNKRSKLVWGVISVVGIVGLGFTAKYLVCSSCDNHRQALTQQHRYSLASELVRIVREEPHSALRDWLLTQNPWTSGQVILSLDNTNDPASRARLAALNAIASLHSLDLSTESRKGWGLVLRDLANSILHPGELRSEFVAKSYQIENPDLRAPASK